MIVEFDKSIYSDRAVRQAVVDYLSIADIEITDSEKYYICLIKTSKYDMEITKLEFSNYVLNLSAMGEKTI